jgi:hypothetical protein
MAVCPVIRTGLPTQLFPAGLRVWWRWPRAMTGCPRDEKPLHTSLPCTAPLLLTLDQVSEQRVREATFLSDRVEGLAKVRDRAHFHQFACGKLVTHDDGRHQR